MEDAMTPFKISMMALLLGLALTTLQSRAETQAQGRNCAARAQVIDRLTGHFGESRRSVALGRGNRVVEVFASASTGSWSITVTLPNGLTCLVASGMAYEAIAPEPQGVDA
jgi:hypothetical protein